MRSHRTDSKTRGSRKLALVVLTLALGASWVSIATASRQTPPPLPPQAADIARQAGKAPQALSVERITPAQFRANAAHPGAVTEGTPPGQSTRRLASSLAVYCWNTVAAHGWDVYPFDRHVQQHTSWCGNYGGTLTARTTFTTHSSNLCGGHDDYNFRISGGIGYTSVYAESGAYFDCPLGAIYSGHYRDWIDVWYNTQGGAWILNYGQ
jgi:hypothetical protein